MAAKTKQTESATLELYRIALENAENQPAIATIMSELGYQSATLAEGKALLDQTRKAYNFNKTEDNETIEAYSLFVDKKSELESLYSLHRKKAKVIFRKDAVMAGKLAITGCLSRVFVTWLETVKTFYTEVSANEDIQNKLVRLKITAEELNTANSLIHEVETARSEYLREVGESQDATKVKDAAFAKMDDWMSEFYAVARIGLEDNPQLLEALGKVVRS